MLSKSRATKNNTGERDVRVEHAHAYREPTVRGAPMAFNPVGTSYSILRTTLAQWPSSPVPSWRSWKGLPLPSLPPSRHKALR